MSIRQIGEGIFNEIFKKREDLFNKRFKICTKCALFKPDRLLGPICNPGLYMDPVTKRVSRHPLPGFIKGCGCVLRFKTRVEDANCEIGKW